MRNIKQNGLSFVIFGVGHDYTFADSGEGGMQIFSHPFVPKGSKNYAGQYYFLVPDEHGEPLDCVKDDRAHCTFTPALGTTFNTVGETTVEVHYYREYVYEEETVVVEKTVSQKIQVVNHGSKSDSTDNLDVYSDGYGFIRPLSINTVEVKDYVINQKNAVTKLSSMPWRATGLGEDEIHTFFTSTNLTDVSEFQYVDTSHCTKFYGLFAGCRSLVDISAVADWNVDSVTDIYHFGYYSAITSVEALAKWNTSNVTGLYGFLQHAEELTSLHGLENWDVSNVIDMSFIFDMCVALEDISAIANWNTISVEDMQGAFIGTLITDADDLASWNVPNLKNISQIMESCEHLTDLSGLSNWTAELLYVSSAFSGCDAMVDISGIHGLDVHLVQDFSAVFSFCTHVISLNGLEDWDVSSGNTFYRMFKGCPWISNISALADWDMSNADNTAEMFQGDGYITGLSSISSWRMNPSSMDNMHYDGTACYSSKIGKDLYYNAFYYFDYADTRYTNSEVEDEDHPLSYPTYDASGASSWGVTGRDKNAFDTKWTHKPSWN